MNRAMAEQLIAAWKPRLGLADWDVRLAEGSPAKGNRANVDGWSSRRIATIAIHADAPDAALPRLVVHELLHLGLVPLKRATEMLTRHTPPAIDAVFEDAWDDSEHQLIHALEGTLTGDPYIAFGDTDGWTKPWQVQP